MKTKKNNMHEKIIRKHICTYTQKINTHSANKVLFTVARRAIATTAMRRTRSRRRRRTRSKQRRQ